MKRWKFLPAIAITLYISTQLINAQSPIFNTTQYRSPFAKETLTVSGSSTALTSATYNPTCTDGIGCAAEIARIICEDNGAGGTATQIRYHEENTAPSATVGTILNPGDILTLQGYTAISKWHGIRRGGTSVTCYVTYYRYKDNTP